MKAKNRKEVLAQADRSCDFCNSEYGYPLLLASNEYVRACQACYETGNFHRYQCNRC